MALEIERKFLVKQTDFLKPLTGQKYRQAYLSSHKKRTVRIRLAGEHAYLTVKGKSNGPVRKEYEYRIPFSEGQELLRLCPKPYIEKTRYKLAYEGKIWEIDVFENDNEGLVMAEIELSSPDEAFISPDWLGEEVTKDPRYYNSNLAKHPYSEWK